MTDHDSPHTGEELPDFLALGIEAMAQSPEGRAVRDRVVRGQVADIADLFGIDLEQQEPPHPDPCATCRIRDHWCCDPWETQDEHEGHDHED